MITSGALMNAPLPIPAAAAAGAAGRPPGEPPGDTPIPFSEDLLRGAEAISEFLFGDRNHRRRVYHLVETTKLPHFRLGALLCARRSVLLRWVEDQEKRGM